MRTVCGGSVIVLNCRFTNNVAGAPDCTNGSGAAIYAEGIQACILDPEIGTSADVTLYNCRFDNNIVYGGHAIAADFGEIMGSGGAITCVTTMNVTNCLFHDNSVPGVDSGVAGCDALGGRGGAIYLGPSDSSFLQLRNCTFANNAALGIYEDETEMEHAGLGQGGAIFADDTVFAVNCILWDNTETNDE
jgi:hypothetical protein